MFAIFHMSCGRHLPDSNVALDLARERKGGDPAFDHMEQDLECLDEMTGRILTVARLDASSASVEFSSVNLTEAVVSAVVRDAVFEARKREIGIDLTAEQDYWVQGNPELLHSAVENVVRNAVRYTNLGTSVDVGIDRVDTNGAPLVRLVVRDHGPGVPDVDLVNIFRPFYRVAESRDRRSGGAGLGLAIAERVIRIHHGTIRAENDVPHGLRVIINLQQLL